MSFYHHFHIDVPAIKKSFGIVEAKQIQGLTDPEYHYYPDGKIKPPSSASISNYKHVDLLLDGKDVKKLNDFYSRQKFNKEGYVPLEGKPFVFDDTKGDSFLKALIGCADSYYEW